MLHLERALEQVDNALTDTSPTKTSKKQSSSIPAWPKICSVLRRLENDAAEKGETGLAITLSKPFQRLLKYPLLFQNLLFHTDPSTFEYESTLQMVAEVESIVRSIEDEKIQKEERDKTRDVFARIEGLDKVRQVALPKPSRVLLEERQYAPPTNGSPLGKSSNGSSSPPPAMQSKPIRGKSSFKRLSDVLSTSSKKDLWLVVFNDVVLLCQRTGTTSLPLVAATNSRTNSLPELASGKSKYATTSAGRRGSHTRPRNLYKFVKVSYDALAYYGFLKYLRLRTGPSGKWLNLVKVLCPWKSRCSPPSPRQVTDWCFTAWSALVLSSRHNPGSYLCLRITRTTMTAMTPLTVIVKAK